MICFWRWTKNWQSHAIQILGISWRVFLQVQSLSAHVSSPSATVYTIVPWGSLRSTHQVAWSSLASEFPCEALWSTMACKGSYGRLWQAMGKGTPRCWGRSIPRSDSIKALLMLSSCLVQSRCTQEARDLWGTTQRGRNQNKDLLNCCIIFFSQTISWNDWWWTPVGGKTFNWYPHHWEMQSWHVLPELPTLTENRIVNRKWFSGCKTNTAKLGTHTHTK